MKKSLLLFLMLAVFTSVYAGKKPLIEHSDEIKAAAIAELDTAMMAPEGRLYLFAQQNQISGLFVFDITIYEKGKVATVFVSSNEGGSLQSQSKLKDFIKDFDFDFKMPKGKKYKFSYQLNFNP